MCLNLECFRVDLRRLELDGVSIYSAYLPHCEGLKYDDEKCHVCHDPFILVFSVFITITST